MKKLKKIYKKHPENQHIAVESTKRFYATATQGVDRRLVWTVAHTLPAAFPSNAGVIIIYVSFHSYLSTIQNFINSATAHISLCWSRSPRDGSCCADPKVTSPVSINNKWRPGSDMFMIITSDNEPRVTLVPVPEGTCFRVWLEIYSFQIKKSLLKSKEDYTMTRSLLMKNTAPKRTDHFTLVSTSAAHAAGLRVNRY